MDNSLYTLLHRWMDLPVIVYKVIVELTALLMMMSVEVLTVTMDSV